jgi:hypothetical protein
MTRGVDPYRTLGVTREATLDEVKRAYRRLAKEHHPDSGGEAALPRFLAIQAAYEELVGGTGRRGPERASPRPSAADPTRADATRRAYGSRARRHGASTGRRGGQADEATAGATAGEPDATRGGGSRRRGGGERPSNRATLGSTTYDGADEEPFEPDWSGGSWYGTSSGTYWTLNPKEYADPRKHGPEYQARARRGRPGDGDSGAAGTDVPPTPPDLAPPEPVRAGAEPAPRSAAPAPTGAAHVAALIESRPAGTAARIALALGGGIPPIVALAWLVGEVTGCGRAAATCEDGMVPLIIAAGVGLLLCLFVLPRLAAIAASGTLMLLVVAVPATVFLSATGGSRQPEASAAVLGIVLAFAWGGGAVFGAVRARRPSMRPGPVS